MTASPLIRAGATRSDVCSDSKSGQAGCLSRLGCRAPRRRNSCLYLLVCAGWLLMGARVNAAAPSNDDFNNRLPLAGMSVATTGSNVDATRQTGEPVPPSNAGGKSVWWTWTAPVSGSVTINTRSSGFDTLLAVYTNATLPTLGLSAYNDDEDSPDITTSLVAFEATAGVAYQIMVDGYNGASGLIQLNLLLQAEPSSQPRQDYWVTDGSVNALVATNGIIYLGGDFQFIGPDNGGGVVLDSNSGKVDSSYPLINGSVNSIISDGAGGYYIGGQFNAVGGLARSNLVHLRPNKTVDPGWAPNPDGLVNALVLSEDTLYVGGAFTNIAGTVRKNLAGLNPTNGLATAWDPSADAEVRVLLLEEGVIVVGGEFTVIGGAFRTGIAAVFTATDDATSWDPGANGGVYAMAHIGDVLFVAGEFTTIGLAARSGIAAVDVYFGLATGWAPQANSRVTSLAITCDAVFAGGHFTAIGGASRNYVAALDPYTGVATAWNAQIPTAISLESFVSGLSAEGDTLYICGKFAAIGGKARAGLAAVDVNTGLALDWIPAAGGALRTLHVAGNQVYVGGGSVIVGGQPRNFLAALDQDTGHVLDWNPSADGQVTALAMFGSRIYAGGSFSHIGGQNRIALAALDRVTGVAGSGWDANISAPASVLALAVSSNALYVGGSFNYVGAYNIPNVAAVNLTNGSAYGWYPSPNASVQALALANDTLYLGGSFTQLGLVNRYRIAAVNALTGDVLAWNAYADNTVRALAVNGNRLLIGGDFAFVYDAFSVPYYRSGLANLSLNGTIGDWVAIADGPVHALATAGNRVYAGGQFMVVAGQSRPFAAALDSQTGQVTAWNPNPSYFVYGLALDGNKVFMGGTFAGVGDAHRAGFAAFPPNGSPYVTNQPKNQIVAAGQPVTLAVGAEGQGALAYQWRLNGTNLPGATSPTFTLPAAQPSNAGLYDVVISNSLDRIYSQAANVIAYLPPSLTTQPASQTVNPGTTVTWTVTTTGNPQPSYQWRLNGVNLPGANGATLTLTNVQPENGGTYSVIINNVGGAVLSSNAALIVASPPLALADNFANRVSNNSFSGRGSGNNLNATREPGEPFHAGKTGGKSLWFSWVAPARGIATFNTRGSAFDTLLAVYTGASLSNLTEAASDDDRGGFATSLVSFNATAGTEYLIAIDGLGGGSGNLVLAWRLETATADFPQITSQPLSQTLPVGATATLTVAALGTPPLYYQWYFNCLPIFGATNAVLTVTNVQPWKVGRYTVQVVNLTGGEESEPAYLEIGANPKAVSFDKFLDLLAGTNSARQLTLHRRDGFPTVSAGTLGSQILNNFGASTELGEPIHAGTLGGASRWFGLTPASDGQMTVDTIGSDIDTLLAVYTGTNLFSLRLIASDDNGAPDHVRSLVSFRAGAGIDYMIAVDGVNGAEGNIKLNWYLAGIPTINLAPASQTVAQGGNVLFSVSATSPPPLTYQWLFNGAVIAGATNYTYLLQNVQPANAGSYSVIVSNSAGAVTNTAVLTVSIPLLPVSSARMTNRVFQFLLTGETGRTYTVEATTNWVNWVTISNFVNTGVRQISDPASTNLSRRYYRAKPQ